jgi:hypothetical protein
MNTVLKTGGLKHVVSMATSEHTVMQNEALVALNLMVSSIIGKIIVFANKNVPFCCKEKFHQQNISAVFII